MPIKIFNTMGRKMQDFIPINKIPNTDGQIEIGIYHCGPTVYWDQHIGNMRAVVIADLIKRIFNYNSYTDTSNINSRYRVNLIRNYTDVGHLTGDNIGDADNGEDRMDKAATREGLDPTTIANKYIDNFEHDIKLLNADSADAKPRATLYIKEIQAMVNHLLALDIAYETAQGIYFDISKYPEYTKLSGQKLDLQHVGTGHGEAKDNMKRNNADFALWIYAKGTHANALQTWNYSPAILSARVSTDKPCAGFPGWHIECSVMSRHFLGSHFDIHMGGIEHIPVHHTNEIAQSECANGEKYVNYWIHNEHILIDGQKMSKSEGNVYFLKDIINKDINPIVLRYFFLQAHYRSKQNFTWEALLASHTAYNKLKRQIDILKSESENRDTEFKLKENYQNMFLSAINNDFNTPQALAIVWKLLKDKDIGSQKKLELIERFDQVLGLEL